MARSISVSAGRAAPSRVASPVISPRRAMIRLVRAIWLSRRFRAGRERRAFRITFCRYRDRTRWPSDSSTFSRWTSKALPGSARREPSSIPSISCS
jgi:hypothetical protein